MFVQKLQTEANVRDGLWPPGAFTPPVVSSKHLDKENAEINYEYGYSGHFINFRD